MKSLVMLRIKKFLVCWEKKSDATPMVSSLWEVVSEMNIGKDLLKKDPEYTMSNNI